MKKLVALILLVFVLTSCGTSKPTKFYTLSSVPPENTRTLTNKKILVGVDTVSVAGYIERPQIVTIEDSTEIKMSEYNRWAEPLSYSMQRVVAENISSYLGKGMAKPMNTSARGYDYVVVIELNKLDGQLGNKAELDAWWTVTNGDNKVLARERTKIETPLGDDYNDLVKKSSELIGQISYDIAKKISSLK